jgi:hypothetical protein
MNRLHPLEHWGHGFESDSRYGFLSTFILYLCCPLQVAASRRADPLSKESYRLSIIIKETEVKRRVSGMAYAPEGATGI